MSKHTADFYNKFSTLYPLVDFFLKPQKRKLCQEINSAPQGSLLDIGVGTGSHLKLYKQHRVTGIDTSLSMLETAGKQNHQNIKLLQMNGESLLFQDETFDYVVLSHVIAVVDNPDKLLAEVFRVLKADGKIFILNHFTPKNWLRHVDYAFSLFSGIFHFKSVFDINKLEGVKKFSLLKEINLGPFSYFKILVYVKA